MAVRAAVIRQVGRTIIMGLLASGLLTGTASAQSHAHARSSGSRTGARRRPLTPADVQKLWAGGDDTFFANEIRLRGLTFTPSGEWIDVDLPKLTGVPPSQVPNAVAALRKLVPPPPSLDTVSQEAPPLINNLKSAAQSHSEVALTPLVDSTLMANKASIYDMFDPANFRAFTLGAPKESEHGDVGLPFFELTNSNVEKLYYIYFTQNKSRLVVQDIVTGDNVAQLYMHDEQILAQNELQTMFRALNDGDPAGLKAICTSGLYQAIETWGGDRHPGDRLTRGRTLTQVSVQTSVPLDQKSIRVVSKVSYPLTATTNIAFFVDFERVGNELKIVRIRDDQNKVVVFDPNMDNYLNRRYSLPDAPALTENDVAMSDEDVYQSMDQIRAKALRALEYQDQQKVSEMARLLVESDPTGPEGYGVRAAADLMQHKYEDADRDAHKALELKGTVYFVLERHATFSNTPLRPVVLGISSSTIDYLPSPGMGDPEKIPMGSVKSAKFAGGKGLAGVMVFTQAGPFLKLQFKDPEGKKNEDFDFADFGTHCPSASARENPSEMMDAPSNGTCGTGQYAGRPVDVPYRTPQAWHEDLSVVSELIEGLRKESHN
ncbi:MAG TPA: hypothetical protein VGG42_01985 [Acidobacteriaceae bacterium]|jgi:hypothetical protein